MNKCKDCFSYEIFGELGLCAKHKQGFWGSFCEFLLVMFFIKNI